MRARPVFILFFSQQFLSNNVESNVFVLFTAKLLFSFMYLLFPRTLALEGSTRDSHLFVTSSRRRKNGEERSSEKVGLAYRIPADYRPLSV